MHIFFVILEGHFHNGKSKQPMQKFKFQQLIGNVILDYIHCLLTAGCLYKQWAWKNIYIILKKEFWNFPLLFLHPPTLPIVVMYIECANGTNNAGLYRHCGPHQLPIFWFLIFTNRSRLSKDYCRVQNNQTRKVLFLF